MPDTFNPKLFIQRQLAEAETTRIEDPQTTIRKALGRNEGFFEKDLPEYKKKVSKAWSDINTRTATEDIATNPAVSGREFYFSSPEGIYREREVPINPLAKMVATAPEKGLRTLGAIASTAGHTIGLGARGVNRMLGGAPQRGLEAIAQGYGSYLGSPIGSAIQQAGGGLAGTEAGKELYEQAPLAAGLITPQSVGARQTLRSLGDVAMLGGATKLAGAPVERVAKKALIDTYEKSAMKAIKKPVQNLYKGAPAVVKEKLPGETVRSGENALKTYIVKYG